MVIEKKYMEIVKAVIDECMEREDERCITITLRSVQFDGKLYIRMEDRVEPLSIWKYLDLGAVSLANRQQGARERADAVVKKILDAFVSEEEAYCRGFADGVNEGWEEARTEFHAPDL